ncbi:unnamed protein product, partial [Amoebophrya sp. A25]
PVYLLLILVKRYLQNSAGSCRRNIFCSYSVCARSALVCT